MSAPLYLSRSGRIDGGSLLGAGSFGYYWSSTVYSSESARNLSFYATSVNPEDYRSRYIGFSLRCVARLDSIAEKTCATIRQKAQFTRQRARQRKDLPRLRSY